jgi:RNA polymerase subunit RPABC4/transcription elongation factor Spt4
MIECQNCGQVNTENSNFCRFCGTKFIPAQFTNGDNYQFSPPHPYSWKTDELQIAENKPRKPQQIKQVKPLGNPFSTFETPRPQPLAYRQPNNLANGYHCPRCAAQVMPRVERKVSTTGWIVFAVLMVVFFPIFWIGLLIKEDVKICPVCNIKIN